jgi:transcriptional antiterminator RfaH
MDWLCDINWFAIHTKRFRETIAASSMDALGLEVFLPMVRVERPEPGPIRLMAKPLFPGYCFSRFDAAISLDLVERAQGVLYVVKSGAVPIPVGQEIMCEIKERVEADGLIRLQQCSLSPGDHVRIQEGPLAGMMGRVEVEMDDHKRVAILLEALWNARLVIERSWVEAETA